ncbi:ankyrin repeat domain-containing protein [Mycoplasmatota bacterium]|nr:ankyrin repeat domain-containing protein [Mycoplasmatota bacterium]
MNNNILKILLYGTIFIVLTATGILTYTYFYNTPEEETTTTEIKIDDVYEAILNGDDETYTKYINDGGDLSFAYPDGKEKGRTPLEILIDANDLQNAQKIIENGFDLSKVDNNHIDTIRSIIAYNEDFNYDLINNISVTLIEQVKDEIEKPDSSGASLLMDVITTDNVVIVTEILKYVRDIDKEYNGETALTYACGLGHENLDIIKKLVSKGADINYKGEDGYNCLMSSIMGMQTETITYLLNLPNLDINAVNDYGQTALHLCVEYTNVEAVDILLQNSSIDPLIEDEDGITAKEYALDFANLYPDTPEYTEIANKL